MKIALVHDWLTNVGGAERVLFVLHELFSDAPIYTSVFIPEVFPEFAGADIRTTFLQKVPVVKRRHQLFPYFRTMAFEGMDFSGYDVVLSDCHAEAKGVITPPETLHICFCYTPTRYYWNGFHEYKEYPQFNFLNPLIKMLMPFMANRLRLWDRCAADRVDVFIAQSHYVAERIKKYYRRESMVIHPPVDTDWLTPSDGYDDYFLLTGRLIPYKRVDIAVDAFNELGLPLKITGVGSEQEVLKRRASSNIEFLGRVPDKELASLYSRCKAFIFPPEEDFGITPLEAMAAGRPVIAYGAGGALETVVDGETGIFFNSQDPGSLIEAVRGFDPGRFDPEACRNRAEEFGADVFKKKMEETVNSTWTKFRAGRTGR
ncbi:MAG: glycosyltransferase [Actinobacteria bacterium]|nr:glycosyltransferase [Actinomycetota bacterium]